MILLDNFGGLHEDSTPHLLILWCVDRDFRLPWPCRARLSPCLIVPKSRTERATMLGTLPGWWGGGHNAPAAPPPPNGTAGTDDGRCDAALVAAAAGGRRRRRCLSRRAVWRRVRGHAVVAVAVGRRWRCGRRSAVSRGGCADEPAGEGSERDGERLHAAPRQGEGKGGGRRHPKGASAVPNAPGRRDRRGKRGRGLWVAAKGGGWVGGVRRPMRGGGWGGAAAVGGGCHRGAGWMPRWCASCSTAGRGRPIGVRRATAARAARRGRPARAGGRAGRAPACTAARTGEEVDGAHRLRLTATTAGGAAVVAAGRHRVEIQAAWRLRERPRAAHGRSRRGGTPATLAGAPPLAPKTHPRWGGGAPHAAASGSDGARIAAGLALHHRHATWARG